MKPAAVMTTYLTSSAAASLPFPAILLNALGDVLMPLNRVGVVPISGLLSPGDVDLECPVCDVKYIKWDWSNNFTTNCIHNLFIAYTARPMLTIFFLIKCNKQSERKMAGSCTITSSLCSLSVKESTGRKVTSLLYVRAGPSLKAVLFSP